MMTETIGMSHGKGEYKWSCIIKGSDNCFYCLPDRAEHILKIDPSNNVIKLVGEKISGSKCYSGFAYGDFVFGIPFHNCKFLKFNIKTKTSEFVGDDLGSMGMKWTSGALADDGCVYCFPYRHNRILKFDPNDDTTSFIGEEIEGDCKFTATIKADNGYVYGIPYSTSRVAKINVATQEVTFLAENYGGQFYKWESGVKGMDGNIYCVPYNQKKWLKIDTVTETSSLVGEDLSKDENYNYKSCVVGEDCNIYAIAYDVHSEFSQVIKFDTVTQEMSKVGNRIDAYLLTVNTRINDWSGSILHPNGYIYCAPSNAKQVLKIKTNHIRDEGKKLFECNAKLIEFNKYINTNQFEYIYISHKDFYDRVVNYRINLIVETVKRAMVSFDSSREPENKFYAELLKMQDKLAESTASNTTLVSLFGPVKKKIESDRVICCQTELALNELSAANEALVSQLESERVIRYQAELNLDEAKARARETESSLQAFRSEIDGLRMELEIVKDRHKVEMTEMMIQFGETEARRKRETTTAATLNAFIKQEPNEAEARACETEGSLQAFHSEVDGLRMELEAEKDRRKVEIKKEPNAKNSPPSLSSHKRKKRK